MRGRWSRRCWTSRAGSGDAGGPAPQRFPDWFVAACAPEQTPEELQRWLRWWRELPPAEKSRAEAEQPWSLDDWVHWMQPDERTWFWWDARVEDERRAVVVVDVPGWPSPLGSPGVAATTAGAVETRVLEPSE